MSLKSYPSENLTAVQLRFLNFTYGSFSENLTAVNLDLSYFIYLPCIHRKLYFDSFLKLLRLS